METHDLHYSDNDGQPITACGLREHDGYVTTEKDAVTCPTCRRILFKLPDVSTEQTVTKVTRTELKLGAESLETMLRLYLPQLMAPLRRPALGSMEREDFTIKFFVEGNGYRERLEIDSDSPIHVVIERTEKTSS